MLASTVNNQLVPTVAGMLLIGKVEKIKEYVPTAESAFQAFNGAELTVNESFYLPLLAAIEKIINYINARNPEQEVDMGLFRMSIPDFDKRAVREAVVNAFAHRDYTQPGRVLVQTDAEGMTISNPGGLIEGVPVQNLLNVPSRGRNSVLADALKRIVWRSVPEEGWIIFAPIWTFCSELHRNNGLQYKIVHSPQPPRYSNDDSDFRRTQSSRNTGTVKFSSGTECVKTRPPRGGRHPKSTMIFLEQRKKRQRNQPGTRKTNPYNGRCSPSPARWRRAAPYPQARAR